MHYHFCLQTGHVFWGIRTPHAVPVTESLYRAMRRPDADRRMMYRLRAFFA